MPEWNKSTVKKTHKSGLPESEVTKALPETGKTAGQDNFSAELIKSNPAPIPGHENLIASNSAESAVFTVAESRFIQEKSLALTDQKYVGEEPGNIYPDTIKSKTPKKIPFKSHYAKIKFKNGKEETVKIIYQSGDSLRCKPVEEQGITRTVMMNQVETILPDTRKTEKLGLAGLILSIFGLIPILGIPFAIMAFIFGVRSLRKIKKYPEKYKGKGIATASKIIGAIEILCYILLAIGTIIYGIVAFAISLKNCTGG